MTKQTNTWQERFNKVFPNLEMSEGNGIIHFITKEINQAKEEEKKRIIKEYGRSFNDGCGCCMFESLEEALKKEMK